MKGNKCLVSWCPQQSLAQGLCKKHYRRARRKGSPIAFDQIDVQGILEVSLKALAVARVMVEKFHRMNSHKSTFELCEIGSCKEHHELSTLFSSKEDVQNDPSSPTT